MIDLALIVVIALLLGLIAWDRRESKLEREKLMRMIYAKTHVEYKDLEAIEKIQVKANIPMEQQSDEIPIEQLTDEQFDKHIKDIYQNG